MAETAPHGSGPELRRLDLEATAATAAAIAAVADAVAAMAAALELRLTPSIRRGRRRHASGRVGSDKAATFA